MSKPRCHSHALRLSSSSSHSRRVDFCRSFGSDQGTSNHKLMAETIGEVSSLLPSADILLARRVQELALNHEQPAHLYISRNDDDDDEPRRDGIPSEIPVIDLSKASPSDTDPSHDHRQELHNLRSALSEWGCFQAIGHGVPSSCLDEARRVTREFFQLPMDEKKKVAKGVEEMEGYGADPVPAKGQFLDWSDRLYVEVFPEHRRKPEFWPENPPSFRVMLEDYMTKMRMMTEQVSRAMARSLDLEDDCFLDLFGKGALLQGRFNYYSPCPRPDLILGLKPHTDGTSFTVIMQDAEGLQVMRENRWITVPTKPDTLLVLMGDQMEIMSNGIFKPPLHRVLTHSHGDRISIAAFYSPEPHKEIGPADGLINEARPKAYKNMKDYADIHWGYYQKGSRAIHEAKV
ncbi:hypothetical protein MLD38_029401 [Melastoma candidum]|uniref:Uncharacterized protein n=1 Tax=Melastoma candidum TaxID=119954 RepID=A0ACB9N4H8_9MYRT|nr:hypothetical protein MLD38_029401 [Melastoma candidum]